MILLSDVIIIGGGAAGMMAGIAAAKKHKVTLIEKNEKLGKKMYITGKGRCNVTNAKDIAEFFDYIPGNSNFLYSSLYTFTNIDVMDFLNKAGVELKVERGDRVFPVSDKSSDIINAFQKELEIRGVNILLNLKVKDFVVKSNKIDGVLLDNGDIIKGDFFIVATGGVSYPQTGSNGEVLKLIEKLGHKIVKLKPSLVPIVIDDPWIDKLQGLSLKNVELSLKDKNNKVIFNEFGEMLFTHFGISGPIVLSGSRVVNFYDNLIAEINLKPALSDEELDKRIQKDFAKYINKDFRNSLNDLLPQKLIEVIILLSEIEPQKKVNLITKEERKKLVYIIHHLRLNVKGLRPIAEAIITAGGVDVREINPSDMKSKLISNLYFAGEMMDVDGYTGGFNMQIALSTGYLAGQMVGEEK